MAAKSSGELPTDVDPEMSEWGNPVSLTARYSILKYIGVRANQGK